MVVLGSGLILPSGDYKPGLDTPANLAARDANIEDEWWRLVYITPVLINIMMLVAFFFFIRVDSIMFSLSVEDETNALILIEKVYD